MIFDLDLYTKHLLTLRASFLELASVSVTKSQRQFLLGQAKGIELAYESMHLCSDDDPAVEVAVENLLHPVDRSDPPQ